MSQEMSQLAARNWAGLGCPCGRVFWSNPLPLTLCSLRLHEGLDEQVGSLRVEGQGVAQRLQVRALLQEGLLEAHTASVEVLLWAQGGGGEARGTPNVSS